jgi:hypothetical protein
MGKNGTSLLCPMPAPLAAKPSTAAVSRLDFLVDAFSPEQFIPALIGAHHTHSHAPVPLQDRFHP